MKIDIALESAVVPTARVSQLFGIFDVPPTERSCQSWSIDLPIEEKPWQIGLIVGPSGSGKSTLSRQAFPGVPTVSANHGYEWPEGRAIVDGFPEGLSIKDITGVLSSVGFSSPPSWIRAFRHLSTGEQFRATVARALLDPAPLVVLDEFTSVVDRNVAQIGSAAIAKAVRRTDKKIVAVTCHYDVEPWLCPDWVIEMPDGKFSWRLLRQRPPIQLEIRRVAPSAWHSFKRHRYMNADQHKGAKAFVAHLRGMPVAYTSVFHYPHPSGLFFKEHRSVCIPDYQGVGIGNALSDFIASAYSANGKPYRSTTANPAFAWHRMRSKMWKLTRQPEMMRTKSKSIVKSLKKSSASNRLTVSFEYVGPPNFDAAQRLGII